MNKFNFLCVMFMASFISSQSAAATPRLTACEKKLVEFQRQSFADEISQVDGEEFDVKRVEATLIESIKRPTTLTVVTQIRAARMQACYFSTADIRNSGCVLNVDSLGSYDCENEDFIQ